MTHNHQRECATARRSMTNAMNGCWKGFLEFTLLNHVFKGVRRNLLSTFPSSPWKQTANWRSVRSSAFFPSTSLNIPTIWPVTQNHPRTGCQSAQTPMLHSHPCYYGNSGLSPRGNRWSLRVPQSVWCLVSSYAAGQLLFEDFLRTEYSEENLLFWLACEDYKKIFSGTEMATAAKRIYAEFVQVDAPRQVRLSSLSHWMSPVAALLTLFLHKKNITCDDKKTGTDAWNENVSWTDKHWLRDEGRNQWESVSARSQLLRPSTESHIRSDGKRLLSPVSEIRNLPSSSGTSLKVHKEQEGGRCRAALWVIGYAGGSQRPFDSGTACK